MNSTVPMSADGAVLGSADDLGDGDDDGDDAVETMHVDLDKVRPAVTEIVFCVTIYCKNGYVSSFKDVRDASITIINEETGEELCSYNLKEKFSTETAVVVGALVLNEDGEWEFEARGKAYDGGLQTLVDMYT